MHVSETQLAAFCRRILRRPVSEDELVVLRVRRELAGAGLLPVRVSQAEARARRLVLANVEPDRAFHRAIAWARSAIDSTSTAGG